MLLVWPLSGSTSTCGSKFSVAPHMEFAAGEECRMQSTRTAHCRNLGGHLRATLAIVVTTVLLFRIYGGAVHAQAQDTTVFGGVDALAVAGASVLYLGGTLLWERDSVTCVPCDRTEVPAFDRWAIAPVRPIPGALSDYLLIGIGVSSWVNLVNEGSAGRAEIAGSVESFLITAGITEVLKRAVGRKRPVLYTPVGVEVAGRSNSQESWPSGHSSAAASLAASYWLARNRISSGGRYDGHAWVLAAGALGVAALRVAAAEHFPSDVLSGLVLGVLTASVVHSAKF